ncbi:DNA methyltransferase [Exiguobacterium profundum]|uniref:DNA methyltransferase n=1 Tax=Exiguobacterium profundum TaxID=307643 RepID=UPI0028AD057B|nr:DNA methyltransferase [Exiguobacterium profundum]
MSENEQLSFSTGSETNDEPVVCLGLTFKNDDERRAYFREELRKKLPELKQIEGFPIGEDEDIIALSDPPYYTACPNPWINECISEWENQKSKKNKSYHTEPFASDVSEGKNDPIYTAHTYHTKVPYKAIMRYILHYTEPGDIILDGFSGTGMTGVAANLCGDSSIVKELLPQIPKESIGQRHSVLCDLSPIATFIGSNYATSTNPNAFLKNMDTLILKSERKFSYFYQTKHTNGQNGQINYIVWSDVFSCPECEEEIIFYKEAFNKEKKTVEKNFCCPKCKIILQKEKINRIYESVFDEFINKTITVAKQVPIEINYIYENKKFVKNLDNDDRNLIQEIMNMTIDNWVPTNKLPTGKNTQQPISSHSFTHVHHFHTKRNLIILSDLLNSIKKEYKNDKSMRMALNSVIYNLTSKLVRYNLGNRGNGILNGTLYISSLTAEANVYKILKGKVKDLSKAFILKDNTNILSTQSIDSLNIQENSVDYIFTDPPFGANINYSELNFIWESWLKVLTSNNKEAIINSSQNKNIDFYYKMMENAFKLYYKALKPNRWMTVEFSNSKASVWNVINDAIQKAGFVIANVSALDKKQGSFKAVTSSTAVKQDLVISAYKPSLENINKIREKSNTSESAWIFVEQHLSNLNVFSVEKESTSIIVERTPRILFDRMIAYHVQNGLSIPISSPEFQKELSQRYPVRDGMIFLESQVMEYDRRKIKNKEASQLMLFVSDENSAIEWLRQQLTVKPQTRQDLHTQFMKEIQHIAKHEKLPELDDLLVQNFLRYNNENEVPSQIVSYFRRNYPDLRGLEPTDEKLKQKAMNRWYVPDPNKQADLEKLREKSLLREFNLYVDEMTKSKKKLKEFRTEAIRAGFKKAWSEKDYQTIVDVGNRLPETVIQEDDKLLMYFDNAQIKLGL